MRFVWASAMLTRNYRRFRVSCMLLRSLKATMALCVLSIVSEQLQRRCNFIWYRFMSLPPSGCTVSSSTTRERQYGTVIPRASHRHHADALCNIYSRCIGTERICSYIIHKMCNFPYTYKRKLHRQRPLPPTPQPLQFPMSLPTILAIKCVCNANKTVL